MAQPRAILQDWYLSTRASLSASVGYRYPGCTTKMLKLLDHAHEIRHADAGHRTPISSEHAAREFQIALAKTPTRAQQQCVARLKSAWTDIDWSPDVAIKSFFDLDTVYFGGLLREKCRLKWKESEVGMRTELGRHDFGKTWADETGDVPTARVVVNAEKCLKDAACGEEAIRETFGTLLHEMIHAHHLTRCIGHPRGADEEHGHGKYFQACAAALHVRTVRDLGFGVRWSNRPQNLPQRKPRMPNEF